MQAVAAGLMGLTGLGSMFGGLASRPSSPGIGPQMAVIAGKQQQEAYADEANMMSQQSVAAYKQGLLQAYQNDQQVRAQKESQAVRFASSGVRLAGSPLGILTETQELGDQASNAVKEQSNAQSLLLSEQGLSYLRQGNAAAFSGVASSLQQNYDFKVGQAQSTNAAIGAGINGIGAAAQGLGMFGSTGFNPFSRSTTPTRYRPTFGQNGYYLASPALKRYINEGY